jgi:hypothetical protein
MDMTPTPVPFAVDFINTTNLMNDLGILPVVTLAAVLFLAAMLYKRMRG